MVSDPHLQATVGATASERTKAGSRSPTAPDAER